MVFTCTAVVTDTRANMWLAGRSTFISWVIIVLESFWLHPGWFLEFLYRPYSGGFWSVLVDDWDTRRGEVCRPICRRKEVKRRCFCLKRCEQITVLFKNRWNWVSFVFLCNLLQGGPGQLLFQKWRCLHRFSFPNTSRHRVFQKNLLTEFWGRLDFWNHFGPSRLS